MQTDHITHEGDLLVTTSAANKVRRLVEEEANPDLKLRVFVPGAAVPVSSMVLLLMKSLLRMIPP